jgi:hypothetical protein
MYHKFDVTSNFFYIVYFSSALNTAVAVDASSWQELCLCSTALLDEHDPTGNRRFNTSYGPAREGASPGDTSKKKNMLGCTSSKKKYCANKRFCVTSNLRYMYGVLNVDEIKN